MMHSRRGFGAVDASRRQAGTGGRTVMMVLVADLGGTHIKLGLVDGQRLLARGIIPSHSDCTLEQRLPAIAGAFARLCSDAQIKVGQCGGVAFGVPTLADIQRGRATTQFAKFSDIVDLDLIGWCERTLGLPFAIENDARAAAVGEWLYGAGRGCDNLAVITLGTGIGTAVILGGRPLRGPHGQAGNLCSHFPYRPGAGLCSCGVDGCFEASSASWSLPRRAALTPGFGESPLSREKTIDYAAVFRLAAEGEGVSLILRAQALEAWGDLCVGMIHAFDPERVVIGGGIMRSADVIVPAVQKRIDDHAVMPCQRVAVHAAECGDDAALLGLAHILRERVQ